MRIAVVIATTGRPAIVAQTLRRLERQTRPPDRVLVIGAAEADAPTDGLGADAEFHLGAKGSATQRNRALDMLEGACDVAVFLDDDFVPAKDFMAGVALLMAEHADVVAASGHLLADGFNSAGLSFAEADALIEAHEHGAVAVPSVVPQPGAYGCNMIVRLAALSGARFDENLPLYGWLEDLDFSAPLAKVGRVVRTNLCVGVHLGFKSGRVPGVQLGYSQIANPAYLAAKGTMGRRAALTMAARNLVSNSVRSLHSEAYVDRRGRLRGNLLALGDLLKGRSHPTRVLGVAARPRPPAVSATAAP